MSMMRRTAAVLAIAVLCTAAASAQSPAQPERLTVPFSDPGRIGKVELDAFGGTITIRGTARKDVLINARSRGEVPRGRRGGEPPPGLRRIPQLAGFDIEEANNVVEISTGPVGGGHDFEIEVPARTNLEVSLVNGGEINIRDVEGEIEVENVNGSVTLTNVSGAVVADSVNGAVKADITRVAPDKPMALTTLNGTIDVTLPSTVRATFKLRSERGEIFTDFDLQLKSQSAATAEARRGSGPLRIDVNRDVVGTVNGGGPEIELRSFNGAIYLRKGK